MYAAGTTRGERGPDVPAKSRLGGEGFGESVDFTKKLFTPRRDNNNVHGKNSTGREGQDGCAHQGEIVKILVKITFGIKRCPVELAYEILPPLRRYRVYRTEAGKSKKKFQVQK